MLNKIIHWSLANRLTVLLASCAILIAGVIVILRAEIDIFPDLNAPTVAVMTEAAGLAPEEVERTVTYPIETAVNGALGVRRVRSSSATVFQSYGWNLTGTLILILPARLSANVWLE